MADIIEHHNESRKFNDLCTVVVCLSSFPALAKELLDTMIYGYT